MSQADNASYACMYEDGSSLCTTRMSVAPGTAINTPGYGGVSRACTLDDHFAGRCRQRKMPARGRTEPTSASQNTPAASQIVKACSQKCKDKEAHERVKVRHRGKRRPGCCCFCSLSLCRQSVRTKGRATVQCRLFFFTCR